MSDRPGSDYASVFETLKLSTADTVGVDMGATLAPTPKDWRDTLRSSLPQLPVGSHDKAQFRLAQVLGRGGMGVVHLAYQSALGRHVALKTVPAERTSREAENALLQEARIMGLVEHPNVVPVHIIGQDENGRPIIVMKRIDGTAWNVFLDGKQAPDTDDPLGFHLTVLLAVCRAISFAHARRILHRDIKPENVMIGKFGEVYVLDWGLAVSLDSDVPFVPSARDSDSVVGTPAYMAPEMTVGEGAGLGVHTDVFLLGAVLYHILTAVPPNKGESLFDVLACSYEGRPRTYPDSAPAELREICERAMAHDPSARHESADELREDLEDFLAHRNSHELTTTANARLAALEQIDEGSDRDETHRIFGEARFGFMSALQIWPENPAAKAGLDRCLRTMIDYELRQQNVSGARILAAQLDPVDPQIEARIDELERVLGEHAAKLEKIAYDYDETVGIAAKRWVVALMGIFFLLPPIWQYAGGIGTVPSWLRWVTDDPFLLMQNTWAFGFIPVLLGMVFFTERVFGDHKVSRVFAKGLLLMYAVGITLRTSSLWASIPLHAAVGAEAGVYGASLMMLGLSIDRRLFAPGISFSLTAILVLWVPEASLVGFCGGGFLACVLFLTWDRIRPYLPARLTADVDR